MISIEKLSENVWLVRVHEDDEKYGDDYFASCVVHKEEDVYWLKGFVSKGRCNVSICVKEIKNQLNIDKLYFVRKSDLTNIKVL